MCGNVVHRIAPQNSNLITFTCFAFAFADADNFSFAINANWRRWSLILHCTMRRNCIRLLSVCVSHNKLRSTHTHTHTPDHFGRIASDVSISAVYWIAVRLFSTARTNYVLCFYGNCHCKQWMRHEHTRCNAQPHESELIRCISWDLFDFIAIIFYPENELQNYLMGQWLALVQWTIERCGVVDVIRVRPYAKCSRGNWFLTNSHRNRSLATDRAYVNIPLDAPSIKRKRHWRLPISFFFV